MTKIINKNVVAMSLLMVPYMVPCIKTKMKLHSFSDDCSLGLPTLISSFRHVVLINYHA
jgi:hypothetical protein